jgi:hypothetical protein
MRRTQPVQEPVAPKQLTISVTGKTMDKLIAYRDRVEEDMGMVLTWNQLIAKLVKDIDKLG